ncbi:MAG TPA: pectinesterase family protein [Flavisolibacter sp.]|nr:pectinesterase family protein [Flavisolibacter sp.]
MLLKILRRLFFVFIALWGMGNGGSLQAQQPAFPGAEGAGMYTTGGRGTSAIPTTVFEVTNLNDDNNPGSLRYALQASVTTYPYKTIVFRISGTIHLNSKLNIRGNTTIAGQTAPGDGICIADHPVVLSGNNIIVRYMRFRLGDKNQKKTDASGNPVDGSGSDDAFGGLEVNNIIIDHCSVSWSSDEALTIYRGDNLTIQWCFVTEPLNYSYHFETGDTDYEQHGYGGIWGAKRGSFHHNLLAHCRSRNPRFAGISTYTPNTVGVENADFRNNVIYNWGINTVYGGEGGNYNVVNNYYKWGPNTGSGVKYRIANPGKTATIPYGKWYVDGNYVDGSSANTANNWAGVVMQGSSDDPLLAKATTAFDLGYPYATQTAVDAYESVLQNAGAILPKRDTLDQRIVNNVRNRNGSIIDVQGGYPHGTPYNQTVSAWPTLTSTAAPTDTDHDGMPDSWETSNGLNPNNPGDRNGYNANGYTNLENYLNSIMSSNPSISITGTLNNFSQTTGTPSSTQTYSVSGMGLTDNITVTPPVGYQVSADGGGTWYTNASPLTLTYSAGSVSPTTITVRLNSLGAGLYAGSIVHSSTSASVAMPVNGVVSNPPPAGTSAIVALDGSGSYSTIQAAIDAAPTNSTSPYIIYIKNGKYKEKVSIPSNKPFIHVIGESAGGTIISWDDYSGKVVNGVTIGTSTSATLTVNGADFFMMNVTVENTTGNTADGPQALAINVNADRCAFKNCRFNGGQDTVLTNGDGRRHYFRNCYIDGNTDFIFGAAIAVFDSCTIFPRDRYDGSSGGYITAANTASTQAYGLIFRNCIITKNRGITSYTLGRPWQNDAGTVDKKHNKTVFLNTAMSSSITPAGWSVWDGGTNTSIITYAEYKSIKYNGSFVDVSGRVSWSKQLSDAEAAPYFVNANMFGSWDPCAVSSSLCTSAAPDLAISNIRAQRSASGTLVSWNISWPVSGVTYEVYRSRNNVDFAKINEFTSATDTIVAFSLVDALPTPGITYSYFVKASKGGYQPNSSSIASVNITTPLDGEFRSAGSGYYNNASSGTTANATSIWEKYVASSSSWVLQPLGTKPGSSVTVTIKSGHTVVLDALNSVNSLVIETGATLNSAGTASSNTGLQTLRVGNGTQPVSAHVRNDGTLGSATGTNDAIVIEAATTCANLLFTGTGTTSIARFRPLGFNPNNLSVLIDQDMTFKFNSVSFTGYYSASSNNNSENVTITINAGKTVTLGASSQFHLGSSTSTTNQQGNVTYNLNGTLDLSATSSSNMVPSSTNPASNTIMNINNGGVLKTGVSFGLTNTAAATTTYGISRININEGGLVDATATTTLNASSIAASGFFIINGTGILKRRVAASAITFPVGTSNTTYNPVTISNTGTIDNFSVSLKSSFDSPPAASTKVVNKQWDITEEVSGGSNVSLKLGWIVSDHASAFDAAAGVSIMHFNGTNWEYAPATIAGTGAFTDPFIATASNFTTFSPFGVINTGSTLPLALVLFKGTNNDGHAALAWTTSSEVNTDYFVVEKSMDNRNFTETGRVAAKGSAATNQYSFTDAAPLSSVTYYRLKMVDRDGKYTYSVVAKLTTKRAIQLVIYPNPAQGIVAVYHPVTVGKCSLELIGVDGRKVKSYLLAAGTASSTIAVNDLPKGFYVLRYIGQQTITTQLIKD